VSPEQVTNGLENFELEKLVGTLQFVDLGWVSLLGLGPASAQVFFHVANVTGS
jgi:hypothetical protein